MQAPKLLAAIAFIGGATVAGAQEVGDARKGLFFCGKDLRRMPRCQSRANEVDFATFLNYFALGLLIFVLISLFYGFLAIHDVPYEIAKHRNHPHQDAIHAAGWVSLFTLHAIWPFLWIWATLYRPDRGWGLKDSAR
jgi:hypothetical protein